MPRLVSVPVLVLLAAAACVSKVEETTDGSVKDDGGGTTDTGVTTDTFVPTTDTATTTTPPEGQASCALLLNPLVVECTATLGAPGPATLTLSAPGVPTRTFESAEKLADHHQIYAWGLKPDTTYTWELAGQSGSITTGGLPAALNDLDIELQGTLFGIDAVLVYVSCGWFVIIDGDGDVIWGQPTSTYDSIADGMMWSQEDRSVLAVRDSTMSFDQSLVVETHISGAELLRLEPGDFELDLTHDVGRWGPYTYLLGEDRRVGGFEVWEGTTWLGTWMLDDAFPTTANLDTSHVNGISVTEDGQVVVSVHGFDAVVAVDGDPTSPTFLELLWHAAGEPGGFDDLPNPTYVPEAGVLFLKQHNASRHGDDLWVFDNVSQPDSRALRMTMDHVNGRITEDASFSTGNTCFNQGGATPIDGGALVTCANSGDVYAFREGAVIPDWSLNAACSGGSPFGSGVTTRAFPVMVR